MIVVPVLHCFTLTAQPFKETCECTGQAAGANWMAPLGAWLLSAILIFAGVVLGLRHGGRALRRQLLMTRFDAEASLQSLRRGTEIFLLDVKYNVLHIAGEETMEYYLVPGRKDPVQVTPTPAPGREFLKKL